jgi:PiT family inorganic phosphate transporter
VCVVTTALVLLAAAFAISMGAHYTGACMGMPRALGALSAWRALLLMAPLTFTGAVLASHGVAHTVGHDLVRTPLRVPAEVVVIAVAFVLTSAFNGAKVPTSTIQILVFSVVGTALATGGAVRWRTIGALVAVWAAAPVVAWAAGFSLTRALDLVPGVTSDAAAVPSGPHGGAPGRSVARALPGALVVVGAAASFSMGANDVANATGALVGTKTFSPLVASVVGGAALAVGVLTWGRPLLERVAFDIVTVDRAMAAAAQLVQAAVVLSAVAFGFFTSMNQALIAAMAGTGYARGRATVHRATVVGIARGWVIGPLAAATLAYLTCRVAAAAGVTALSRR